MKKIILCDLGNIMKTSILCNKYNLGVDVGSFRYHNYSDDSQELINEYLAIYKNNEIYSVHGIIADLFFENNFINKTIKDFEAIYKISCKLNCKNIIFHNGYIPEPNSIDKWLKNAIIFWKKYLSDKNDNITIHLENYLEENPDLILNLIQFVEKDNLKMCLDIGHANISSKIDILKWIEISNKNIGFVHLHNNNGKSDQHNELANGTLNLIEICNALEQYSPDAIWALETNELEKSIKWLIKNNLLNGSL